MNRNKYIIIALFTIIISVFCFQFHFSSYFCRTHDEGISVYTSNGVTELSIPEGVVFYQKQYFENNDLSHVFDSNLSSNYGNSIVFDIALHFWTKLFGISFLATRMLTMLLFAGSILLIFVLSKELFENEWVGLLSALLFALHPLTFLFAIHTRTYSCCFFFVLLSTYIFVKWRKLNFCFKSISDKRLAVSYGLVGGLAILVHYYCLFCLFVHFMFFAPSLFKGEIRERMGKMTPFILMFFIVISWLWFQGFEGLKLMGGKDALLLQMTKGQSEISLLLNTSIKSVAWFLQDASRSWLFNSRYWCYFSYGIKMRYVLVVLVVPFLFLLFAFRKSDKPLVASQKPILFLSVLAAAFFFFATLQAISSGHTTSFSERYSFVSLPFFFIVLAYGIYSMNSFCKGLFKVLSILVTCIFILNMVFNLSFNVEQYSTRNYFEEMNHAVQLKLASIKNIEDYTIEHEEGIYAIGFNFHLFPMHNSIKQRISRKGKPLDIILVNDKTKEQILLYHYPEDCFYIQP